MALTNNRPKNRFLIGAAAGRFWPFQWRMKFEERKYMKYKQQMLLLYFCEMYEDQK